MAGYGNDAGLTAYLTENGLTLPGGTLAVLRQRGSAYIDATYNQRFSGQPTAGYAQERSWPRTGATAFNATIPADVIPNAVIQASYAAAYAESVMNAATPPGSLSVTIVPGEAVKRAKAGPVEVEYFGSADALTGAVPLLSSADGLLAPFLHNALNVFAIMVV